MVDMVVITAKTEKMDDNREKKAEASFFKKIKSRVRHGMIMQSIRNKLITIGIDISPYYWYQEGANTTKIPEIPGTVSDYSVQTLGPDDMEMLTKIDKGWSASEKKIPGLLDGTEKCIALKHKDEIAAFMWINLKEFKYKSIVLPMKSNEAYLTYMFTDDRYRGKNLAPYLRYKSYEMLKEMGRTVLYSISISCNTPAVKFKEKLDARKVKLMLVIQLFNRFHWSFRLKSY